MAKMTNEAKEYLEKSHSLYCDYNQTPTRGSLKMAATGHPRAADYLALRAFFDELQYACNASARFFSFKSQFECSQYWAPELRVSSHPDSEELKEFFAVYPASSDWMDYLDAVAKAGYPAGAGAKLQGGSWTIYTESSELKDALFALAEKEDLGMPSVRAREDNPNSTGISLYPFEKMTPAVNKKIAALIKKHHKGFILPKRTPEITAQDAATLPLEQKKFMLANVKELTVTDRKVLVPLIPMGGSTTLLEQTVAALVALLGQGFPFSQAKDWLSKFLTKPSFNKLAKQYGSAA